MIIGKFYKKEDNFTGKIEALTFTTEVAFYPNTTKTGENAPDYRIYRGKGEVGAAWKEHHDNCGDYISVKLDAPNLPAPINAALFANAEDGSYRLVWDRQKQNP